MCRWGQYGFHKKRTGTCYIKLVFFHPVGCAGHVVHSSAVGPRNINALFFMLDGPGVVSTKNTLGHITLNMSFLHPV
jgi:hypothetical protein